MGSGQATKASNKRVPPPPPAPSIPLPLRSSAGKTSPYMAINPRNAYHTSAVLGAALDVATSPLRFLSTGFDAWASGNNSGGGGGAPMMGDGGAFGCGGRAPPPGTSRCTFVRVRFLLDGMITAALSCLVKKRHRSLHQGQAMIR